MMILKNEDIIHRMNTIQYYLAANVLKVYEPGSQCGLYSNIVYYTKETGVKEMYNLDWILFVNHTEWTYEEERWKNCLFTQFPAMKPELED